MRYFFCILISLAWGLWIGGLVCTFLFIQRLFDTMNTPNLKPIFDQVAPAQFTMSERFELVIGMLALLATAGLYFLERNRFVAWLFGAFAMTAALAMTKALWITPKMVALIKPGSEPPPEFRRLHGMSMGAGVLEVLLLLIATAALPAAFGRRSKSA